MPDAICKVAINTGMLIPHKRLCQCNGTRHLFCICKMCAPVDRGLVCVELVGASRIRVTIVLHFTELNW